MRPAIVVEVGVWKGASVVTMAKEMQRLKLDAVVIAIDTWLGSSEHYLWEKFIPDLDFEFGYPRLYHKFAANICKEGVAGYCGAAAAGFHQRLPAAEGARASAPMCCTSMPAMTICR